MSFHSFFYLDERIQEKASNGEICPYCLKTDNIKLAGCNPDVMHLNQGFDCLDCKGQWEGY